jgi:hypothetical protein
MLVKLTDTSNAISQNHNAQYKYVILCYFSDFFIDMILPATLWPWGRLSL